MKIKNIWNHRLDDYVIFIFWKVTSLPSKFPNFPTSSANQEMGPACNRPDLSQIQESDNWKVILQIKNQLLHKKTQRQKQLKRFPVLNKSRRKFMDERFKLKLLGWFDPWWFLLLILISTFPSPPRKWALSAPLQKKKHSKIPPWMCDPQSGMCHRLTSILVGNEIQRDEQRTSRVDWHNSQVQNSLDWWQMNSVKSKRNPGFLLLPLYQWWKNPPPNRRPQILSPQGFPDAPVAIHRVKMF